MNSKILMTVVAVINILQGIGFYVGAEQVTQSGFPELTGNALLVGKVMHEALAFSMFAVGILIFFLRNNTGVAAKNSLMGIAFANLVFMLGGLSHFFTSPAKPPIPVLIIMLLISLVCFYSASKIETD